MKPALSLDGQIALLRSRGLAIPNEESAKRTLYTGNYYRLSGYFRQFQVDPAHGNNAFEPGTTFESVVAAVELNVRATELLTAGLARVEVAVRSRFAHELALIHGDNGFYLDRANYFKVLPAITTDRMAEELARAKSPAVRRYAQGGDFSKVPIWVAVEVLPFGSISKMLSYLSDDSAARALAHGISHTWSNFGETIHSLAVLRNRCAHHGQLWHRRLDIGTPIVKKERRHEPQFASQSLHAAVLAVRRILKAVDGESKNLAQISEFFSGDDALLEGFRTPAPR